MKNRKSAILASNLGLLMLTIAAVGLSIATLQRSAPEGRTAIPATSTTIPTSQVTSGGTGETGVTEPPGTDRPTSPEVPPGTTITPGPSPIDSEVAPPEELTVAILGDGLSTGDPAESWVGELQRLSPIGNIVNYSAPGRGYIALPRSCDEGLCGNFGATVDSIADVEPDLVITFGGVADGDQDIREATAGYFAALREKLPDAQLVGLNPVSTDESAPYWMTMHGRSIESAVGAVDGTYINVGQPSLGSGEELSVEAETAIAEMIAEAIR